MDVFFTREAESELALLPVREREALRHAYDKLVTEGEHFHFPHSSQLRGTSRLRELRPRSGHSKWRAFYGRIGGALVIAAVGPEAKDAPVGFRRAVAAAERRLAALEREGDQRT